MAVLRSVSEDDLTNVVQLSPLGKQDHRRAVLYRAAPLRIRIIFASWIQIRILITVKIHNLKTEPWRAEDAHPGGSGPQNGAPEGL